MIVRFSLRDFEDDDDMRIERPDAVRLEVRTRIEDQAVHAWWSGSRFGHERAEATVRIGETPTDRLPLFTRVAPLEQHAHTGRRVSVRRVEYMRRDRAHETSNSSTEGC